MSIFNRKRTVLIRIDQDTPTFRFGKSKTEDNPVVVDSKTFDRWKSGMAVFDDIQREMEAAVTPSPMVVAPKKRSKK